MTTKILALVDALGNLARFALMPGQRGEITGAKKLIEGLPLGALLADKAYDADHFRDLLKSKGVEAVIPARRGRLSPATHDAEMSSGGILSKTFSKSSRSSNGSP